jgi:hypothetical protein
MLTKYAFDIGIAVLEEAFTHKHTKKWIKSCQRAKSCIARLCRPHFLIKSRLLAHFLMFEFSISYYFCILHTFSTSTMTNLSICKQLSYANPTTVMRQTTISSSSISSWASRAGGVQVRVFAPSPLAVRGWRKKVFFRIFKK